MYLIDTNVFSETKRPKPKQGVLNFFEQVEREKIPLFMSMITQGELLAGVDKLKNRNDFVQAQFYEVWVMGLIENYRHNILPFDEKVMRAWASLLGKNKQNPVDKQIGATALVYDLTLVTRNIKHFADTGVKLLNPFDE